MNAAATTCQLLAITGKAPDHAEMPSSRHVVKKAAIDLFSEQGFHNVSLRKLASALGMQAGSLYHHIEGKQELLFELIDEYEKDLLHCIRSSLPKRTCTVRSLASYIHAYLGFIITHEQRHGIARFEFRNLSPREQEIIETTRSENRATLEKILLHSTPQQIPSPRLNPLATHLFIAMLDETSKQLTTDTALTLEDVTALLRASIISTLHSLTQRPAVAKSSPTKQPDRAIPATAR